MRVESLIDKSKEIDYLQNLYLKEKKIIDESKIKDSFKEFFSGKKIKDFDFKETPIGTSGKYIIDVNWDLSKDKYKKFCKTVRIAVFGDNLMISNRLGDIRIENKDWNNKKIMKKINGALKNPIPCSNNSFSGVGRS